VSGPHRLTSIEIDAATLPAATAEAEHERRVAIFDLVEKNHFQPIEAEGGPYALRLSQSDSRLVFEVTGPRLERTHVLSLTPLKGVLRDYLMICDSYNEVLRGSDASKIEAVDMGRRGLHNEGADVLMARLDGKIGLDHETARRLFTLICALYRRG
jgi:uncharacterized protein (UPF0262 family)